MLGQSASQSVVQLVNVHTKCSRYNHIMHNNQRNKNLAMTYHHHINGFSRNPPLLLLHTSAVLYVCNVYQFCLFLMYTSIPTCSINQICIPVLHTCTVYLYWILMYIMQLFVVIWLVLSVKCYLHINRKCVGMQCQYTVLVYRTGIQYMKHLNATLLITSTVFNHMTFYTRGYQKPMRL